MALGIPEGYEEIQDDEVEAPEGYEPIDEVEGSPGFLWRNEIMSELDDDPETRRLAMQMLYTEGGGTATMEALVNRTAMIREKVPGWTINDELNSGFYGPINRGYAQTVEIDPSREARYQQDIEEVRAGSNVIQGRTDQGYPGDPNWRGPGRVHVPENPEEVYNYWTGKRAGVHFTHEDSAEFANKVAKGGVSSQSTVPEGYEEIPEAPPATVPEGYEEIPAEGKKSFFATEEEEQRNEGRGPNYPPELKAEEQAAKGQANREQLQGAIAKVEKEGYMVPHFIGLENEPEGDRAPTRDMEQLVGALARQQTNAVRAQDLKEAARIGKERAFWEEKIKKEGMTAEQWKKQTGEEDPRYPHEPAYTAKQSPEGLIDHVENAIQAGKENWVKTNREEGPFRRGVRISVLGLGETINRYAYSPIVHGLREAIDYIAPGSDLANTAKKIDDAFYKNTVQVPHEQRTALQTKNIEEGTASEVAGAVGTMVGDLPVIMLTGGLLPELKVGMELVNAVRHGAAAMTIPAMRAGTDAAEQMKKAGGNEWQQFAAFARGTAITMGIGSIPMATKSGAATMPGRFASRAVQSVPLASAAVESGRMLDNAASDLFGGQKRPFSVGEHLKQVAPLVLVGGVAGRDTRPSKFERTFGFSPVHLDKADWMRRRMEAEGLAKATPEKVAEWDAQWKQMNRELPTIEEAPPEEAPRPAPVRAAPAAPSRAETVKRAAIQTKDGQVFEGTLHFDAVEEAKKAGALPENEYQEPGLFAPGFTTSDGRFVDNAEAYKIAQASKQPNVDLAPGIKQEKQLKARYGETYKEEPILDAQDLKPETRAEATPPKGGPVEVKRSAQALGIVASPKATKGFEQAREEAKAIADYLNKAEHWGPWNSAIGNNIAAEQKAYDNVMRQNKAWKKEAPNEQAQEGMTMYREAAGDMRKIVGWGANVKDAKAKAAYRAAGALKPEELSVVKKVTTRLEELRQWLNVNGIDVAEVENYVTHMFHTGGGLEPTTGLPKRSLSSYFKYAKPRKYPNYFAAIQAGEKPKSLNLIDIASAYEILAMRAVNNKKFIDRLKFGQARDGNPIVAPDKMEFRKLGYKSLENVPGLQRVVVHPDYHAPLGRIVGRSRIQEWLEERSNNPLLNVAKGVLGGVAEAQKYTKGTMFSFSLFHQVTEGTHALGHRVNPFNIKTKEIDLNDPEQYDAAVHGLMLRPDRASQEQFIQGSGTTNYNLVTKVARKFGGEAGKQVSDLIDGYTHYLFEDYIPRLKMDTYRHIVERNMARFAKDLKSGKTTTAAIKSLSADQANAAYGHLNYTKMARSKTVQHALQLAFLAPDFFEARARFAAQAGKGVVGLATGSKTGTEQLIALANLAIGQYVAARILNQLDHGDPEWDTEHAFAVKTDLNGLLPDKRWISLRSVPEDIIKAGAGGLLKGDIGQAWKEAGRFGSVRLAAFPRVILEGLSGTNWRGEKTNLSKSLRDMVGNVVPMPMQGWADQFARVAPVPSWAEKWVRPDSPASISPGESLLKSMGVQIHRVSPINDVFEMKDEWLKVNDPEEYDRQQSSAFPASKYRGLRYALEDSDWEAARKEAKKLREGDATTETFQQSLMRPFTGSFSKDQRFYQSLDKDGKALYDAALRRRIQVLARYKEHVNPRAEMKRVTVEMLHKRMREAEIEEKKNARKKKKAL